MPFPMTRNKRSFVALENLVDLIVICMESPVAANQTFLVSDGDDLSTRELFVTVSVPDCRWLAGWSIDAIDCLFAIDLAGLSLQSRGKRITGSLIL